MDQADQLEPAQLSIGNIEDSGNTDQRIPNIIGNIEDVPSVQLAQEEDTLVVVAADINMGSDQAFNPDNFRDISQQVRGSRRKRGKSPF